MANHLPLTALLIALLSLPMLFSVPQVTSAQSDKPILGYPYLSHASDGVENFSASCFKLNEAATITSISCQMYIGYSLNEPGGDSSYRFAIYTDNNGQIGELVGQTELGNISKPVGQVLTLYDFQTLSFASPVSLKAGTYWLAAVVSGPNILIVEDQFVASSQRVRCNLNSTSFPSTLSSLQYIDNEVVAIYASGQGASSVLSPPTVDSSNPGMSSLSVNCQREGSTGKLQVFGVLSLYNVGIPQSTIGFSYRQIGQTEWQSIGSTSTSTDGIYSIDWLPPTQGSYIVNATYWGSSTSSFVFKAITVLVTASSGNQTKTVFSVDSNSTVSDLAFDSASSALSFSVTGQSGTTGYVDVCVAKTLVADPSIIQAYIDGNPVNYTVTSVDDSWILHFSYHHSSHDIEFSFNSHTTSSSSPTSEPAPELPQETLLIVVASLMAVAVMAFMLVRRKMHARLFSPNEFTEALVKAARLKITLTYSFP